MKTSDEIKKNCEGSEQNLKEHVARTKKLNIENDLDTQKNSAYMMGWINALKWVVT